MAVRGSSSKEMIPSPVASNWLLATTTGEFASQFGGTEERLA
jgi:hypothetical protein